MFKTLLTILSFIGFFVVLLAGLGLLADMGNVVVVVLLVVALVAAILVRKSRG